MQEIKQRKDERTYSRIRAEAQDIIQGHKRISCLPAEAERGRIEGGRRNVEASCIMGRCKKTDAQDTDGIKNAQELKLEEWARHEKIWFEHADIRKNWKRIDNGDSREAEVYYFEETQTVRKVFRYDALDSDYTPINFINDRISVHNALFSTTKYELLGFTHTDKGFFAFILEQPFIDGAERTTKEEIIEYMKLRGFPNNDGRTYHWNDYYVVGDLHAGNVLKVKDEVGNAKMFVIDPIPYLNTPDEKGGKSQYLPFRIVKNKKDNGAKFELDNE